jgi:hypothetical protein
MESQKYDDPDEDDDPEDSDEDDNPYEAAENARVHMPDPRAASFVEARR